MAIARPALAALKPTRGTHTPPADEGTEHREEAPVRILDGAVVVALRVDPAKLIEQILAGHGDVIEPDAPVVHAVEAHLVAGVLDRNAR